MLSSSSASAASSMPARRFHQIIRLKPECYAEYKACHAAVWPEVLAQIKASGIADYSIAYDASTSLLFASFKYVGADFDADMARMRLDPKTREWWKMTDSYQESLNPGAVSSERGGVDGAAGWWKECDEVFYAA